MLHGSIESKQVTVEWLVDILQISIFTEGYSVFTTAFSILSTSAFQKDEDFLVLQMLCKYSSTANAVQVFQHLHRGTWYPIQCYLIR